MGLCGCRVTHKTARLDSYDDTFPGSGSPRGNVTTSSPRFTKGTNVTIENVTTHTRTGACNRGKGNTLCKSKSMEGPQKNRLREDVTAYLKSAVEGKKNLTGISTVLVGKWIQKKATVLKSSFGEVVYHTRINRVLSTSKNTVRRHELEATDEGTPREPTPCRSLQRLRPAPRTKAPKGASPASAPHLVTGLPWTERRGASLAHHAQRREGQATTRLSVPAKTGEKKGLCYLQRQKKVLSKHSNHQNPKMVHKTGQTSFQSQGTLPYSPVRTSR